MPASPSRCLFALVALLVACAEGTSPHNPGATAASARIVTTRSTESFGTASPIPYVVQVFSAAGTPVVGANVDFQVTGGPATVSPAAAVTDTGGLARTNVTLTDGIGPLEIASTVRGSSVTVTGAPLLRLNTNLNVSCDGPVFHAARIATVSRRAVVLADTLNPSGGFSLEQFQSIATTFDTLVDPLLRSTFGDPTDLDKNARVVLFYTPAINALTPTQATTVLAGYFHERDLFPQKDNKFGACPASNEGEILYLMAPDPDGTINGNKRDTSYVRRRTSSVAGHEYQHLINAGRRMYVNNATSYEETWLNEGLSHMTEELLYYRAAALTPRQNLGGAAVASGAFSAFQNANVLRLRSFLGQSWHASPYGLYDDLATRGASWNLLRYLADHRSAADADTWFNLVNTTQHGLANLTNVFGTGIVEQIRSWATSIAADDLSSTLNDQYLQPSWNLPSVYAALDSSGQGSYPLQYIQLTNGAATSIMLAAGGTAYLKFSIAAGQQASIDWQPYGSPALTTTSCQSSTATTPQPASVTPVSSATGVCLGGGDAGAEYVLIPFFASQTQSAQTSIDVYAQGIEVAPTPARVAPGQPLRSTTLGATSQPDIEGTLRRRALEQLGKLPGGFGSPGVGPASAARNVALSAPVEFTVVRMK